MDAASIEKFAHSHYSIPQGKNQEDVNLLDAWWNAVAFRYSACIFWKNNPAMSKDFEETPALITIEV